MIGRVLGARDLIVGVLIVIILMQFPLISPVAAAFDFSIEASPSSNTINLGKSDSLSLRATYTVSVTLTSGPPESVTLSVSGKPVSLSVFKPSSVSPTMSGPVSSMLTVETTANFLPGSYPVTITGKGGGVTHSTTVTLNVK